MNGSSKISELPRHPPRGRAVAHPSHGPAPESPDDVPARVWLGRGLAVVGFISMTLVMMWAIGRLSP